MTLSKIAKIHSTWQIASKNCCVFSRCKETAKYQYTNMQRRFSKRGIRFHYFIPHDFGMAGKVQVAGFATPNAFNQKGVRIDRKLLSRIQQPRDTCSALARSTGGSSWDINTLLVSSLGNKKTRERIKRARKMNRERVRAILSFSFQVTCLFQKMTKAARGSMLKNTLKKQHQNKRMCFCSGSVNNDDVIQCKDRQWTRTFE